MSASAGHLHTDGRTQPVWWRRATIIDARDLRSAGALMLFLGVALPLIPGYPGLPCPLRLASGVPCPFCGMSTSVKHAVRLQFQEAWAANPAGIAAVATAIALIVVRPRSLQVPPAAIYVTLAAMWVFQLFRFSML